jgi:hypothetical protein
MTGSRKRGHGSEQKQRQRPFGLDRFRRRRGTSSPALSNLLASDRRWPYKPNRAILKVIVQLAAMMILLSNVAVLPALGDIVNKRMS